MTDVVGGRRQGRAMPVDHVKEITKLFGQHRYAHDVRDMFTDGVAMMAYSISNSVDLRHRDEREKKYMDIVGRYDKATIDVFPKIMAHVTMGLEDRSSDVLGSVFHELELHNTDRGQYFTPYELCRAMAEMTVGDGKDLRQQIKRNGFVTAQEPAVGSGAMIIALAESMQRHGVNPQTQLHVQAIDVDQRAAHMAYVQLSLLHIPAEVVVGNTLTMEVRDVFHTPAHILGGWDYRLRARDGVAVELEADVPNSVVERATKRSPDPFDRPKPDPFDRSQERTAEPMTLFDL